MYSAHVVRVGERSCSEIQRLSLLVYLLSRVLLHKNIIKRKNFELTRRILVDFDGPVIHFTQGLHFNMVAMTVFIPLTSDV